MVEGAVVSALAKDRTPWFVFHFLGERYYLQIQKGQIFQKTALIYAKNKEGKPFW